MFNLQPQALTALKLIRQLKKEESCLKNKLN
jgi:hypothetical protein